MDRNNIFAILEDGLAVVVWGAAFIARKIALREVLPLTIIWLRFGMGVSFLGICLYHLLQSNGLLTSAATTMSWIVATTPVFIALLGWW